MSLTTHLLQNTLYEPTFFDTAQKQNSPFWEKLDWVKVDQLQSGEARTLKAVHS